MVTHFWEGSRAARLLPGRDPDRQQQSDSGGERCEVEQVGTQKMVTIDLGDEIRRSDVEEISRCKGNDKSDIEFKRNQIREDSSYEKRERREHADDQCPAAAPTPVKQYSVLTEFLWDFVGGRHQPSSDSEPDIHDEGARYRNAAEKIVEAVSNHHQVAQRALRCR